MVTELLCALAQTVYQGRLELILIFLFAMCVMQNLHLALVSCQCGGARHGCSLTGSWDHAGEALRFHFLEAVLITLLCGCMNILTVRKLGAKC